MSACQYLAFLQILCRESFQSSSYCAYKAAKDSSKSSRLTVYAEPENAAAEEIKLERESDPKSVIDLPESMRDEMKCFISVERKREAMNLSLILFRTPAKSRYCRRIQGRTRCSVYLFASCHSVLFGYVMTVYFVWHVGLCVCVACGGAGRRDEPYARPYGSAGVLLCLLGGK